MIRSVHRRQLPWRCTLLVFAAVVSTLSAGAAARAQVSSKDFWDAGAKRGFQFGVLDMYQHQNRGTARDPNWEKTGGWCQTTAYLNALYGWKVGGYDTLPDAITTNATWLGSAASTLKTMAADWFTPTMSGPLERWLKSRPGGKVGLDGGVQGLMEVRVFSNTGGKLTYQSWGLNSDNTKRKLPGKAQDLTVLQAATDAFVNNRSVIYTLQNSSPPPGPQNDGLWWANGSYHCVTMAGVDVNLNKIWFADPDSNNGNAKSDAGITVAAAPAGAFPGPAVDPIIEAKRFQPTDPIPVAARIAGQPSATPTGVGAYYREATLAANGWKFLDDIPKNERYRWPYINDYRTIERVKAAKDSLPPPVAPALVAGDEQAVSLPYQQTFKITAGMVENVDSFWLFPNAEFDPATLSFSSAGGAWSLTSLLGPNQTDPFGNDFPFGGFQFSLTGGQPLQAYDKEFTGLPSSLSFGTLSFSTLADVTSWDTYFRNAADPTGQTWDVQSFGADLPASPPQTVPEPSTLASIALGGGLVIGAAYRRRRGKPI